MQQHGLAPADRGQYPGDDPISALGDFFDNLSELLGDVSAGMENAMLREGMEVVRGTASFILPRIHHHHPSLPIDAIFEEIKPKEDETATKDAVAPVVARIVDLMKRGG